MHFYEWCLLLIYGTLSMAMFDFHRQGWLDKVVDYHKYKLFEDLRKEPALQIKALIQPAPEGYVDSPDWNFESVKRLLVLVQESETAQPVRQVLRRMLGNTRRKMSFQESFLAFPSLTKDVPNDIYYDLDPGDVYGDVTKVDFPVDDDQDVILVSNPVEARLPSAMISISLLRNILEERAKAARYVSSTRKTIPWKPMKTTQSIKTTASGTPAQNATKQESDPITASATANPANETDSTVNTGAPETGVPTIQSSEAD